MYQTPRPLGPPPNYTARRAVAATGAVLVLYLFFRIVSSFTGDDGGEERLSAETTTSTSTTVVALETPPACEYLDEQSIFADEADWARTIVDTAYALPEAYEPPDLVSASGAGYSAEFRVRSLVIDDLDALRNAIIAADVPEVALLAAYRTIEDQEALFALREDELGFADAAKGTARAGHSEHHLGTTVDFRPIGATDVDQSFGDTATGQWLEDHSWEYGFVISYPEGQEAVTCYKYEPWHYRYVGRELAADIQASGLTLREYLWHWEVTGTPPGASTSAVTSSTVAGAADESDTGDTAG
ncbi:MAG: M15 family metallopeptidase [Acidimicrobiales bacterium]|nr:M15 family metallopeptidase [Acidimicrobiales bacterium]